jgi:hypothetical protein
MDSSWVGHENDRWAMAVSASKELLEPPHVHAALPVAVKHHRVDAMAQEPALPRHLRSHSSCYFPREDAFVKVVGCAHLQELILVVVGDRQTDKHYFGVLRARVGVLSPSQNVCA